jgi:hypothetical protein
MGLLSWLFGHDEGVEPASCDWDAPDMSSPVVNPATGLMMIDDVFNVMGNPYGLGEPGGLLAQDDHMGFLDDW